MKILLDNDLLEKLAKYGLWDEFKAVTACKSFHVLPTFKFRYGLFRLDKPENLKKATNRWGKELVEEFGKILKGCKEIEAPDDKVVAQLLLLPGMDEGEAILFGRALSTNDMIATGDKKALKALAPCSKHVEALKLRIICLEYAVIAVIYKLGFKRVQAKIINTPSVDAAVETCFRDRAGKLRSEWDATALLVEKFSELDLQTGGKLLMRLPNPPKPSKPSVPAPRAL